MPVLIDDGASLDHKKKYGNTALAKVAEREAMKLLIDAGAVLNLQNKALILATDRGYPKRMKAS